MFFYDFLFYAAYKQGIKSRNYADIPILGGVFPVAFCLASNLVSLCIIVIKLFHIENYHLGTFSKIIFGFSFVGLLYFYYRYNEIKHNIPKISKRGIGNVKILLYIKN